MARLKGRAQMYEDIQRPALDGLPPFVISDAFPNDLLPMPASARLQALSAAERKEIKHARWVSAEAFRRAQAGEPIARPDFVHTGPYCTYDRWRNSIDRQEGSAGGRGGGIFGTAETTLAVSESASCLSVYARVTDQWSERLLELLRELSATGFGADVSVGRGHFEVIGSAEDASWLDDVPSDCSGLISLSSFQPAASDPTDGFWEAFTKYGKLGPDLAADSVFKSPLLMFRPGAVFARRDRRQYVGRAVPMAELLTRKTVKQLSAAGVEVAHLAFGLAVPFPVAPLLGSTPPVVPISCNLPK